MNEIQHGLRAFVFASTMRGDAPDGLEPLDRHSAAFWVRAVLQQRLDGDLVRRALREDFFVRATNDDAVIEAFRRGHWALYEIARDRRPVKIQPSQGDAPLLGPSEVQPSSSISSEPTHWLELELVDDEGAPVPNVAYRVEAGDGRVHTGVLDGKGKARVTSIASTAPCRVTFPDLDAREWKAA